MTKPNKQMPIRTHHKFDPDFKRQALANRLSSGKSAEVIAQELGIHSNLLYAWRKLFAPSGRQGGARGKALPRPGMAHVGERARDNDASQQLRVPSIWPA